MNGYEKVPTDLTFDPEVSRGAKSLYPALLHLAWRAGKTADEEVELPPLAEIASACRVGETALLKYLGELRRYGWLTTTRGPRSSPQRYVIRSVRGKVEDDSRTPETAAQAEGRAPESEVPVPRNPRHNARARLSGEPQTKEPDKDLSPPRPPPARIKKVDRRDVTAGELALAEAVLDDFNAAAGTDYRSGDWLAKIVMRIREFPELTADDHGAVIRAALSSPWWRGTASPSVVYGNAALFERTVVGARATLERLRDLSGLFDDLDRRRAAASP